MFPTLLLLPLLLLLAPRGPRGPWGRRAGVGVVSGAVVPPSWADPRHNPCAAQPGGWQLLLWPGDGRCYRIFRRGPPCPASMELTPGVGPGGGPGCRCPPGTALLADNEDDCHPLLEQGPCPPGQYLAPLPAAANSQDRVPNMRAACRAPAACPPGHVFWARDGRCYPRLTRGPCYRGELLVEWPQGGAGAAGAPLGACRCEPRGELGRYYSAQTKTCHEHFTPGPCQEKGLLFLPHGQCGCSPDLPHYHAATGHCYQIDTIGPCPTGHRFTRGGRGGRGSQRAQCRCKGGHVPWPAQVHDAQRGQEAAAAAAPSSACYRPWTRGPCPAGQLLSAASRCVAAPCRPGRLYFPEDAKGPTAGCYKVGVRGPCPKGQVVLFETAVRPALEGISYRGVCGCTGPSAAAASSRPASGSNDIAGKAIEDNRCGANGVVESSSGDKELAVQGVKRSATASAQTDCELKSGAIVLNGTCHSLYSQGPCPPGQWLVPQRRAKGGPDAELWTERPRARARCDCRPGHKAVLVAANGANSSASLLECQPPTVVLATFLNSQTFAGTS